VAALAGAKHIKQRAADVAERSKGSHGKFDVLFRAGTAKRPEPLRERWVESGGDVKRAERMKQ